MEYGLFESVGEFEGVVARLETEEAVRQEIVARADKVRQLAKRSVFALQRREDESGATKQLTEAKDILAALQETHGACPERHRNSAWKGAMEEFLEALFFLRFWRGSTVSMSDDEFLRYARESGRGSLRCEADEVFGALSDLTGEIGRQINLWIVAGKLDEVVRANAVVAQVAELLNRSTASGALRNKVDQANRNLQFNDSRLADLKIRVR